jgi:hypothetical protein
MRTLDVKRWSGRLTRGVALVAAVAIGVVPPAVAAEEEIERTGGPYVPTPKIVVDHMLRLGKVGPKDFVVDLGSGDGVIVLTAAREYKARGFGVDIDAGLVAKSNAEAKRLGVADRASFHVQDVFKADLSRASVVTLYLLPSMMKNLRAKIYLEARPGTRVVSHDYIFEDWQSDDYIELEVPEKEMISGSPTATIHMWIVPARVGGRWRLDVEREGSYQVELTQIYQLLRGSASARGRTARVSSGRLRGNEVEFTVSESGEPRLFKGEVTGETMQGSVDLGGGRIARWRATKH